MKILIVLSQPESAKVKLHTTDLISRLTEKGHKISIIGDSPSRTTLDKFQNIDFSKKGGINRILQTKKIVDFIRENDIQIVHEYSDFFHWSIPIACKITGIPLIRTLSKKENTQVKPGNSILLGDYFFAVSENILNHLVQSHRMDSEKIEVLRYGLDISHYKESSLPANKKKIISIIPEWSDLNEEKFYNLLKNILAIDSYQVRIICTGELPSRFLEFKNRVKFLNNIEERSEKIKESDLIIGTGKVAIEGILSGRPVLLVSEYCTIDLIKKENLIDALTSNFEDLSINNKGSMINLNNLNRDITKALHMTSDELHEIRQVIKSEFDLKNIARKLEIAYQKQIVLKRKKDIPILVYNRVVQDNNLDDINNNCISTTRFDEHMKVLRDHKYEVITFKDYEKNRFKNRFDHNKKQIIITFDGSYEDNYFQAFPILKKYGFKAVVYLISHLRSNKWDIDNIDKQEKESYMMNRGQIKEMQEYGIEFGGHTKTHVKLSRIEPEEARKEVFESTDILEELLGEKLLSFAYPYGELTGRVKKIVEEAGYKFAVTLDSGSVCFSDDLYAIRRIPVNNITTKHEFKRKIDGSYNFIKTKK